MKRNIVYIIVVFILVAAAASVFLVGDPERFIFMPRESDVERGREATEENAPWLEIIAENLSVPWGLAFLQDGSILVTERTGSLVLINKNGKERIPVPGVNAKGEGGLLGIALHPEFEENSFVFIYMTSAFEGRTVNRVDRFTLNLQPLSLSERTEIISGIPGASFHDGGRIAFGPDGLLYITTGDAGEESNAQNQGSLAGKVLRIDADGGIPEGNPFKTEIYSYGHRNPQGITWDDDGNLWSTEHGPSGLGSGFDELNLIVPGGNYGWPQIKGDESMDGMIEPVVHSGADDTWAPASAVFWEGSIFWGGLRGQALYEVRVDGKRISSDPKRHFFETYGRIRTVALGPDGFLYFTTSNSDGRGSLQEGDDKLVRVNLEMFRQ